ncbi:MAG: hypothetical protein EXX96DRAFT_608802 [Benjaminiella poitrasii]|nr:MAG: hypothetical protein EXX96DRAFT_608802 [Benjaminiella poitrasii]
MNQHGHFGAFLASTSQIPEVESPVTKIGNQSSEYDRVITYRNIKKDVVFRYLNVEPINAVAAVHSVGEDGNYGFRAASFDVYEDQTKWRTVKSDMLKTYLKYKNTKYKVVNTDVVEQFKEQRMI